MEEAAPQPAASLGVSQRWSTLGDLKQESRQRRYPSLDRPQAR